MFKLTRQSKPKNGKEFLKQYELQRNPAKDPAMDTHFAYVVNSGKGKGVVSKASNWKALSAMKYFLRFLDCPITETAVSELVAETRKRHKKDGFATENQLPKFVSQSPIKVSALRGTRIKEIFKANRCPLLASFNTTFTHSRCFI